MAHANLDERREYVSGLLAAGEQIDGRRAREIAAQFGCSSGAVMVDLSYLAGRPQSPPNSDRSIPAANNSRAKAMGRDEVVTRGEWEEVLATYGRQCLRCGAVEDITMDHVKPLARGGRHHKSNLQPLCDRCNSSKGVKTFDYR